MITRLDPVEAARTIGDHAREHVEPAGGAFWVCGCRNAGWQRETFQQGHDVDRACLQHRAIAERDLVQLEMLDALGDRRVGPGQEARAHPIRDVAEPQVEACGLYLIGRERISRQDRAGLAQRRDHAVRQDTGLIGWQGQRHQRLGIML